MIVLTDEMLSAANKDEQTVRLELSLWLYAQQILSLKKAAKLAGIYWDDFAGMANERGIFAWDALTPEELEKQFGHSIGFQKKG